MPSGHPFHEAGEVPFIFPRINDQVHVVRQRPSIPAGFQGNTENPHP
jgi:hypothetical protein